MPRDEERFAALAELAVGGANVQPGQVVAVGAEVGQERLVRAIAAAAYRRGALYVDAKLFDPYLKRARVDLADPATLGFVPRWYGSRLRTLAERGDARIGIAGVVAPEAMAGADPARSGRDRLPWLAETGAVVAARATNWTIVPCPHPGWARIVYPALPEAAAYERLWRELWHCLRLDEPDPATAWQQRTAALEAAAARLSARRFDALELSGPGTELTVGLLPTSRWCSAGGFTTRTGLRHLPNIPTEEVFTSPDPLRVDGRVAATRPLVLPDGTIVRGLRLEFEGGRAVAVHADANGAALRAQTEADEGAARLGEVALVDRHGRVGPLGTVFHDTLLDENAASHLAFGYGFPFAVEEPDRARVNTSAIHIDVTVGGDDLDVTGVTREGERVTVLRGGEWRL